jgi:membrane-bound lytic murein transglycosylase
MQMTVNQIRRYMIQNGAPASEVFVEHSSGVVYFDTREVPARAYAELPVVMIDRFNASVAQP